MGAMTRLNSIGRAEMAVAIVVPLVLLALVYGLWLAIDIAVQIGPFDRATIGWATVMPLWFASPALAAWLWRRLPSIDAGRVAAAVGLILTLAATWILWSAVVSDMAGCETSPRSTEAGFLGPAALLGLLVGGGWAISAFLAAGLARSGRPWAGLAVAVIAGLVQFGMVAMAAAFILFAYAGCNRPGTV